MTDLEEVPEQPEGCCPHNVRLFDHTKPYHGKIPWPPYCSCCGQPCAMYARWCERCVPGTAEPSYGSDA